MELVADDTARALVLRREIEELEAKRIEVEQRIRAQRVLPPPRRSSGTHGPDRMVPPRRSFQTAAHPGRPEGMQGDLSGSPSFPEAGAQALGKRRRLQSLVALAPEDQQASAAGARVPSSRSFRSGPGPAEEEQAEPGEAPVPPRPLGAADADPKTRRRNQKLFGALLLGTLERFRQEDQKLQGSEAFVRRSRMLQRAEQKAAEEREALRQKQREKQVEERHRDLVLGARLAAKAEEKEAQLLLLRWKQHRRTLARFFRTRASPPICFRPALESDEIEDLKDAQEEEFEDWLATRTEELRVFAEQNLQRHLDSVERQLQPLLQSVQRAAGEVALGATQSTPSREGQENGGDGSGLARSTSAGETEAQELPGREAEGEEEDEDKASEQGLCADHKQKHSHEAKVEEDKAPATQKEIGGEGPLKKEDSKEEENPSRRGGQEELPDTSRHLPEEEELDYGDTDVKPSSARDKDTGSPSAEEDEE